MENMNTMECLLECVNGRWFHGWFKSVEEAKEMGEYLWPDKEFTINGEEI